MTVIQLCWSRMKYGAIVGFILGFLLVVPIRIGIPGWIISILLGGYFLTRIPSLNIGELPHDRRNKLSLIHVTLWSSLVVSAVMTFFFVIQPFLTPVI